MKPVIVESPYAANEKHSVKDHELYLRECLRWCLDNRYTPYASHRMLTDVLNDSVEQERELGITAGLAMASAINTVFVFVDYGLSDGMERAIDHHAQNGVKVYTISIYGAN